MRKGSDVIGLPVIAFDTGRAIEIVRDLVFDQQTHLLLALLVTDGNLFSPARVIPWGEVRSIGPDAVIVPSHSAIVPAERIPEVKQILERNNAVKGTRILTTDGRDLGTSTDLFFDEQTGAIEGYEVVGGLFADSHGEHSFVPASPATRIGDDVAFVPPETVALMEERFSSAPDAVQASIGERGKLSQAPTVGFPAAVSAPAQQKNFVVGRFANQDVVAPGGRVVVMQGQRVTPALAEVAEREGVLGQLYTATGGSPNGVAPVRHNTAGGDLVDRTRGRRVQSVIRTDQGVIVAAPGQIVTERVIEAARLFHKEQELLVATRVLPSGPSRMSIEQQRIAVEQGQGEENTGDLWIRLRTKLDELQQRADQRATEQRIKEALGRPVTRVILDPQDRVILNAGQLITHRAIQEAQQAGVLDILLGSVYQQGPLLSEAELRASGPGEASLEDRTIRPATDTQ